MTKTKKNYLTKLKLNMKIKTQNMNNIDKINSGTTKGIFMINIPENSSINSQLTVLFIIYHKTLLELLVLLPH